MNESPTTQVLTTKRIEKGELEQRLTNSWVELKQQKHAILGIGLLLVVVSITFSTYVTVTFVNHDVYLVLAPQVIFALYSLLKAFSKIYK